MTASSPSRPTSRSGESSFTASGEPLSRRSFDQESLDQTSIDQTSFDTAVTRPAQQPGEPSDEHVDEPPGKASAPRWTLPSGTHHASTPQASWMKRAPVWVALAAGLGLALMGYGAALATWVAKLVVPALLLGWIWKAALQRTPSSASRWLRGRLTSHGTGFYGLVASATFAVKQSVTLIEDIPEGMSAVHAMLVPLPDVATLVDITSRQLWSAAIDGFIGLSAETILNGVWSMMWPMTWIVNLGYAPAIGLALGLYGAYRIVLHLSPEVRFLLALPDDASDSADAGAG